MPQDYKEQDYEPTARASATKRQDVEPPIGGYGQKVSKAACIDTGRVVVDMIDTIRYDIDIEKRYCQYRRYDVHGLSHPNFTFIA